MIFSLFQRLSLSIDNEGVLDLANEGNHILSTSDIIRNPSIQYKKSWSKEENLIG